MKKTDLLQKCKDMGINRVSNKNKDELLLLIKERENETNNTSIIPETINIHPNLLENKLTLVMIELKNKINKDTKRQVCKNCNELGHNISSLHCPLKMNTNIKHKKYIQTHMASTNCLEDKSVDDYCAEISSKLNITPNLCRTLYNEIPMDELLKRPMDINSYLRNINTKTCNDCNKTIVSIQLNTNRIWRGNYMCDRCWCKYENDRNILWQQIKSYKLIQCVICENIQSHSSERYHYDHVNMFNKTNSICSMVNDGEHIEDIYKEIDKCQIVCLSCHHIITDIEHKVGFTRIKTTLTRKFNIREITEEDYIQQTLYYKPIYEDIMHNIYKEVRTCINSKI